MSVAPIRVLHLLESGQWRGSSLSHVFEVLARGLDSREFELEAWFLLGDGPLVAELRQCGRRVRVVPWTRAYDPAGAYAFWRALREGPFDIVHQRGDNLRNRLVRAMVRQAWNARIVTSPTGRVDENGAMAARYRRVRGADLIVADSEAVAAYYTGARSCVIAPGVKLSFHPALPCAENRDVVVGVAARLVPVKGVIHLLKAIALLRAERATVRLEIAGSGPEQSRLEDAASRMGIADCVDFLGWCRPLEQTLARWNIFALPSLDEGFGLAALQAMACGLPVVASRVGGLVELVEDDRTGILCTPGDHHALCAALRCLIDNPSLRATLGVAGRERARAIFPETRMAEAMAREYRELLSIHRRASA